mgnify:CR=1 FL=1
MDKNAWGKCGGGTGVPSSRSIIENTGTFLNAPVFSFKLLTLCQQLETVPGKKLSPVFGFPSFPAAAAAAVVVAVIAAPAAPAAAIAAQQEQDDDGDDDPPAAGRTLIAHIY